MTDADWLAYCLTAAAVIIAAISLFELFGHYPIWFVINQTHAIVVP